MTLKILCMYTKLIPYAFSYTQSMASELNMYESQVAEHRTDIDRLQRELQEVKKKYYLQKKKEHTLRYVHTVYPGGCHIY